MKRLWMLLEIVVLWMGVGFLFGRMNTLLPQHAAAISAALLGGMLVVVLAGIWIDRMRAARPYGGTAPDNAQFHLHKHKAFAWLIVSRFLFLVATYAAGGFVSFYMADVLKVTPTQAAEQIGGTLAVLLLIAIAGIPIAGWAADRIGRMPVMLVGAMISAAGAVLLITAHSTMHVLLYGGLIAMGFAAFAAANRAMAGDVTPPGEAGRFSVLASASVVGAAAMAGLLGPLVDAFNAVGNADGYKALFAGAGLAFLASGYVLRALIDHTEASEVRQVRQVG